MAHVFGDSEKESEFGYVYKVSGPLVIAENMHCAAMYELRCARGIIKLETTNASIQVNEDTSGLTVGDPVERRKQSLSVELGPGIVDNIFDGIQRPLHAISDLAKDVYISAASCPSVFGTMVKIYGAGIDNEFFTLNDTVLEVCDGTTAVTCKLDASHRWPLAGQHIIDTLFLSVLGGSCAVPGAVGCDKTVISQALFKHSNLDAIVYVGCGKRGNGMAEVLNDFPELTMAINDREVPILKRKTLVTNTSKMPVAAREASIYTGITLAEYFCDQGTNVSVMADSTSRWAGDRCVKSRVVWGYPAYLGAARLAAFYERGREGSVTVVGAVSPPGGDFSDPATAITLSTAQVFWGLDKTLVQRKRLPPYMRVLKTFFNKIDPEYLTLRTKCQEILQKEDNLTEIVLLVSKESLSEDPKARSDFTCPLTKSVGILRSIIRFYDLSQDDSPPDAKVMLVQRRK
ncbi:hypothetical protein PHYSODRAFT_311651 [Phytophthora sojae]|uniref:H(+)-transporting two-sector ATPase n=1 Tax=Phytophthora sojae (strain P6497) TaxID=1094619 RepID=G4YVB2_PHYSP|nr:hypothetical protein PHYSODRAFT_311651 [Phytophthora sojae]EGZ24919.1 hypothetical protein PHYSODRAFT_311651 [Phytophthora sojae]|eukprot:XP_009520207.1 hypothetical protein PHYSODRAFT_311651 [Phytophthora sojae]